MKGGNIMVNYYELLGLNQGASEDEIRAKLKEKKRIWTQRQNAPRPEQQQEASNNLRLVPEIEATLLSPQKRATYDQQLRTAPREEAHVDTSKIEAEDLIQEGWRLISVGNVPDALMVATKATEVQGNNPDAWALLGYCKAQWGDVEDALYEYKRAIKLRPNDASFYFDLGAIYEGMEQWQDAMRQYQRAAQIDPQKTVYRAAMGSVFIKNEMYNEGIDILEKCIQEEPDNDGYKYLLVIAYIESGYQNWTFVGQDGNVPSGFYATTNAQVSEAEALIDKADRVGLSDSDLSHRLSEVREDIASMRKRRFHGNPFAAGVAIIIGLFLLFSGDAVGGGLYFIIFGGLYIASCMTPQYRLNKRIIEGAETSHQFLAGIAGSGPFGWIIGFVIILILLPIMTIWNFIWNYAVK
jgi:Flp pilus assembly protein TadD